MELNPDEKKEFLESIKWIKFNTNNIAENLKLQTNAIKEFNDTIKKAFIDDKGNSFVNMMNWNLGSIFATLKGDKNKLKDIKDAQNEATKPKS